MSILCDLSVRVNKVCPICIPWYVSGSTRDILSTATPILPKTITSNPVIPIAASSTKSGKSLVEKGDDEEELSSYIRFIPASFTIGIFFIGFVVIYVFYYQKLKETNKK